MTMTKTHLLAITTACFISAATSLKLSADVHRPADFEYTDVLKGEGSSQEEFQENSTRNMAEYQGSPYGQALSHLMLGLVTDNPADIVAAQQLFTRQAQACNDLRQKDACRAGQAYAGNILSGQHPTSNAQEQYQPISYEKYDRPAKDFKKIIIGTSAIHLRHGSIIKTQVDRVTRDWLLSFDVQRSPWDVDAGPLAHWHEGMRVTELAAMTGAKIVTVWGTKARKIENRWFAPDAQGIYRFEISPDKVLNFPTGIAVDDHTVIINDTHGISAIAWDSLGADLVVGCGDHPGKADAAYYLASNGVNVYMPTDRCTNQLIGVRTKGVILGSAPVRKEGDGAVIGDRPMAIDVNEAIVVSAGGAAYPIKYYDSPNRYFTALQEYCGKPLNIVRVEVKEYGQVGVVVDEARKLGAKLLGIRAKSKADHDAIASWLKEDKNHHAVLFHTAAYPDGYKLFSEFPEQTSFGDINPKFE